MSLLPIRYVSFDCYGTLIDFRVGDVVRDRLGDRVVPDRMTASSKTSPPIASTRCSARGSRIQSAAWPLVILSNAADSQIRSNVDKLGAPFHAVLTAEQAQAYKPRLRAFEFMFDALGCGPEPWCMHSELDPDNIIAAARAGTKRLDSLH